MEASAGIEWESGHMAAWIQHRLQNWRVTALVLAALMLAASGLPGMARPVQAQDAVAWQVLNLVNQARTQAGLGPLTMNGALVAAAQRHSSDMAANNFLGHTGSDGSSASQRVSEAGYNWATVGENAAQTWSVDGNQVAGLWLGSDGHRANILNPAFIEMGLAYATASNGAVYYTQTFGAQPGAVPPPAQAPATNTPVPPSPVPPTRVPPSPVPPTRIPPTATRIPPSLTPIPLVQASPTRTALPSATPPPTWTPPSVTQPGSTPLPTWTPLLIVTATPLPPTWTPVPNSIGVTVIAPSSGSGSTGTTGAAPGVIMLMEEPGIPWTLWFQRLPLGYRPVNAQGIELQPEDGIPPELWFQVPPALP